MFNFLRNFFKKGEEPRLSFEEKLEDLGISIVADHRLEWRLNTIEEGLKLLRMPDDKFLKYLEKIAKEKGEELVFELTPENLVYALMVKLHLLDQLVAIVSAPFARAGDNPWAARLLKDWHTVCWWAFEDGQNTLSMMEKEVAGYKFILYYQYRSFLAIHIFPRGEAIISQCYKHLDVSPSRAIIVQQPYMPPYTPVIPGAQRPLEKEPPPDKQYPPELSTDIDGD